MLRATLIAMAAVLALVCAGLVAQAEAQTSPFGGGPVAGRAFTGPAVPKAESASTWERLMARIQAVQQVLNKRLADAVRRLKSDGAAGGWLLAGLSFLYGIAHAVGPGHGKAVISSYVLADGRTVRRGVALSFAAAALQALTAVILVGILAVLLNAAGVRMRETVGWLETASYALVALIGTWMLLGRLRLLMRPAAAVPVAVHTHGPATDYAGGDGDHGACCGHAHVPDPAALQGSAWSLRQAAAVVLAVGLRPCTGAIVVLVFALAHGLFLAGVGATFAMALGTAITVSVLAALAVGSKQLALRLAGGSERWSSGIYHGAGLVGSALLLVLGLTLFMASLGPSRPF